MILKNILTSLCLFVLIASPVFSQRDANINPDFSRSVDPSHFSNPTNSRDDDGFLNNVIIKINPMLIATGMTAIGEYGGIIQFPVEIFKNIDAYVGGGYNQSFDSYTAATQPNGKGYTIRAGVYYHMQKKKYVSFQFFYRRWDIKSIYDADGAVDNIISPSTFIFDNIESPISYLENATVNIYSVDIVYGKQYPRLHKPGHLFFEWFIGGGVRLKEIRYQILGNYDPNTASLGGVPTVYFPYSTPRYSSQSESYPDIKLGIMIGFVL